MVPIELPNTEVGQLHNNGATFNKDLRCLYLKRHWSHSFLSDLQLCGTSPKVERDQGRPLMMTNRAMRMLKAAAYRLGPLLFRNPKVLETETRRIVFIRLDSK